MRCHEHGRSTPCLPCLRRQVQDAGKGVEELERQRDALWDACEAASLELDLCGSGGFTLPAADCKRLHGLLFAALRDAGGES